MVSHPCSAALRRNSDCSRFMVGRYPRGETAGSALR